MLSGGYFEIGKIRATLKKNSVKQWSQGILIVLNGRKNSLK